MISFPKVIKLTRLACPNERIRWGKRLKHTIGGRGRSKTSKFDRKFKNNPRLKKSYPILKKKCAAPREISTPKLRLLCAHTSLAHPRKSAPPNPHWEKSCVGIVGSSPLDKTLCGEPHASPTQSVCIIFSSPRNPHAIPTHFDAYL